MSSLPESCGIAFKEWEGVCGALVQGRQTLIVRKGGISEGPGGFIPEHRVFWLYPTSVHQAQQGLRQGDNEASPVSSSPLPADHVAIQALAAVELISYVDRPEILPALEPFHIWTEETIRSRFHYRKPGLWVLGVRIFYRQPPLLQPITAEQLGCKTWVDLEPPISTAGLQPVLDDQAWTGQRHRLESILHRESRDRSAG
jgi:hypothetical protein